MHGDIFPVDNRREVADNFLERRDVPCGDLLCVTEETFYVVDGGARDRVKIFRESVGQFFFAYRIKLHSLHEEFSSAFRSAFEKFFAAGVREAKVRFWFSYGNANTAKIFIVLIFLLGGLDVLSGALTVGNFVALNGYFSFAM